MRLRSHPYLIAAAAAIVASYAAMQYWWLPPEGFLTGDQGTKFLQARAVLEHGPFHPWIDGPSLDIDTAMRWQEPFLLRQGDHLVGVFPWLFATLTAPFLWLFGLRGLYVVPSLSVAVIFLASCRLGRQLGQPSGGVWSGLCAVLATPLVVYGAELWEHAPAVALSTIAGSLLMPGGAARWRDGIVAGVAIALAASLRPEALAVAPAFLVGRLLAGERRDVWRDAASLAIGAAAVGAIVALMNREVYGAAIPQHVSSNLAAGRAWWRMRGEAIVTLVLPASNSGLFAAAALILIAGAFQRSREWRLRAAHAAVLLALSVEVAVPVWRALAGGVPWFGAITVGTLVHTWPFAYVLAYRLAILDEVTAAERTLYVALAGTLVLILATMPHTGGAQWSPRFLLPAAPFAAVLAIQVLTCAVAGLPRATLVRTVGSLAIAVSVTVQVYGLAILKHYKRANARLTAVTAGLTRPDDVIVSDFFWYPQVTATLYPERRFLFTWSPADFGPLAARAAEAGVERLWLLTAPGVTGPEPPAEYAGVHGSPAYVRTGQIHASGSLWFYHYERR